MCGHLRAVGGEGALVSEARTSGHGRGVGAVAVVRMEEQRGEREQRAERMSEREREQGPCTCPRGAQTRKWAWALCARERESRERGEERRESNG